MALITPQAKAETREFEIIKMKLESIVEANDHLKTTNKLLNEKLDHLGLKKNKIEAVHTKLGETLVQRTWRQSLLQTVIRNQLLISSNLSTVADSFDEVKNHLETRKVWEEANRKDQLILFITSQLENMTQRMDDKSCAIRKVAPIESAVQSVPQNTIRQRINAEADDRRTSNCLVTPRINGPTGCTELRARDKVTCNGKYSLILKRTPLYVFCDMKDGSSGWRLSCDGDDLQNQPEKALEYGTFKVLSEDDGYKLIIDDFLGPRELSTIASSLLNHNGSQFSTFDKQSLSGRREDCPLKYKAGFWFEKYRCTYALLTGAYFEENEIAVGTLFEGIRTK